MKVGPRSAGADPGPACYGRGGREPTVTDAYLTTGILGENDLLGGRMTLSRARAEDAIGELGEAMGMGTIQAAEAVLRVATANMVASFLPMIARYGVDHREYSLQAYGGAGPTHAFLLAAEAGIHRLIIPPAPGAMCAVGAAVSDVQMDFVRSVRTDLSDEEGMEGMFSEMEETARRWLSEQGLEPEAAEYERSADMRYKGQSFEIMVGLAGTGILKRPSTGDMKRLLDTATPTPRSRCCRSGCSPGRRIRWSATPPPPGLANRTCRRPWRPAR